MSNPFKSIGRVVVGVKDITVGASAVVGKVAVHAAMGTVGVAHTGVQVGGRAVARIGEVACRGSFNESSAPDTMARICAYCSNDAYRLEYDQVPLPRTKQTVQVKDACCTIEPVPKPSWAPNLGSILYQIYLVNDDTVVLAFKGTDNAREIMNDVTILMGTFHVGAKVVLRGTTEKSIAEALQAEYGRDRIFFTGHSLGGAVATFLAASDKKNYECIEAAHVFNPGTGYVNNDVDASNPRDWLKDSFLLRPLYRVASAAGLAQAKICAHHIFGDAISCLTTGSDMMSVATYRPTTARPHTMANFL